MKKKTSKTNTKEILALAGKGSFDDKKLKDLKEGWKKWTNKINK